jgi:hypothetical protein
VEEKEQEQEQDLTDCPPRRSKTENIQEASKES